MNVENTFSLNISKCIFMKQERTKKILQYILSELTKVLMVFLSAIRTEVFL
jgi:hypothetical protein